LLWILDASVNISMEPFRAFVGDMLPKNQRKSGFAMQSLLIGFGAVLSSALPFILTNGFGVSREATVESPIPPAVKLAFYIGAGVFVAAVLVTIITTREYPPEDMEEFQRMKRDNAGVGHAFREILKGIGMMPTAMKQLSVVQFFTWLALFCMWIYFVPAVGKGIFGGMPLGLHDEAAKELIERETRWLAPATALARAYETRKNELSTEAVAARPQRPWYGAAMQMFGLSPADPDPGERIDAAMLDTLIREAATSTTAPTSQEAESPMVQRFALALATRQVTTADAPGIPAAAAEMQAALTSARLYQEGTAWGGVCFSAYNLIAFGFSFVLLAMSRFLPAKGIHLVCLSIGALGLISAYFVKQPAMLLVSMAGVGVAWASILSMPYAMLANVIPGHKMGFYMGVFNFFIVLPQILAAVVLGKLVDSLLGGDAMKAVLMGGVSMAIASAATLIVGKESETGTPEEA
jgi:maltose/moltooligosaccharide transporter